MSYTRLRYHLVTATEDDQKVLTPEVNAILYPALQNKALDHGGKLLKIGGCQKTIPYGTIMKESAVSQSN